MARLHGHVTGAATDSDIFCPSLRSSLTGHKNGGHVHAPLSPRPLSLTRCKMAATGPQSALPSAPKGGPATLARSGAAWEKGEAVATLPSEHKKKSKSKKKEKREPGALRRKERPHLVTEDAERAPACLALIGEQFPPLALSAFLLAAASRPALARCPAPPPLSLLRALSAGWRPVAPFVAPSLGCLRCRAAPATPLSLAAPQCGL